MCTFHDLCITNTVFSTKLRHRLSWMHPRSKYWQQLSSSQDAHILETSSKLDHTTDCDTDYSSDCSRIGLQPKELHRCKQSSKTHIDVIMTVSPDEFHNFNASLSRWKRMNAYALETFGKDVNITTGMRHMLQTWKLSLQEYSPFRSSLPSGVLPKSSIPSSLSHHHKKCPKDGRILHKRILV